MSLPLLQLSSITTTFLGVGAIDVVQKPEMGGAAAVVAAVAVGSGLLARAKTDPHWHAICEKGHADAGLDDDCIRLMNLTEKQAAEINAYPARAREMWRRQFVSQHSTEAFVNRLIREDNRRREARAL